MSAKWIKNGVSIVIPSNMITLKDRVDEHNILTINSEERSVWGNEDDNDNEESEDNANEESEDDDSQLALFGLIKKVVGLVAIPVVTGIMVSSFFNSIIIRGLHGKLIKKYETLSNNHSLLLQENKLLAQKNKSIGEDKRNKFLF